MSGVLPTPGGESGLDRAAALLARAYVRIAGPAPPTRPTSQLQEPTSQVDAPLSTGYLPPPERRW